ncbi:MAG: hypothetical protein JWM78_3767 [Verrucomicrobiaceae bacterium]|nr:hypothetical protein [Verrucomicrobiaceae bacterium]
MSYLGYSRSAAKPQRPLALLFIVLLHAAVIVALSGGLDSRLSLIKYDPGKIGVIIEAPPAQPTKIAPVPFEQWQSRTSESPMIDPLIIEKPSQPTTLTGKAEKTGEQTTVIAAPVVIAPRVDARFPLTQPAYPPASRRLGEEGTVEVLLYVLADGRIESARVERSSGFARLDEAAVREALHSWRLLPSRVYDVPTAAWHRIAVTFHLKN